MWRSYGFKCLNNPFAVVGGETSRLRVPMFLHEPLPKDEGGKKNPRLSLLVSEMTSAIDLKYYSNGLCEQPTTCREAGICRTDYSLRPRCEWKVDAAHAALARHVFQPTPS